ncbi:hypothetical protein RUM44_009854 [Polyplax serrata]|uniref:Luciferase n=1 Tax=Polyplax serrata TaxID=468196 RepID=A0ABR1AVL0_POLSC
MYLFGKKLSGLGKFQARTLTAPVQNGNLLKNVDKTKNIVYGGDLPMPTRRQSIGSILFEKLMENQRSNDVIQICYSTKYGMTTKKFLQNAVALAERLHEEGIQKGDHIALVGNNSLNMNTALAGIFFLGAVPFPLSHKTSTDEFQIVFNTVRPKFYACDGSNLFTLRNVLKAIEKTDPSRIFFLSHSGPPNEYGIETFSEFIKDRGQNVSSFKPAEVDNPEEEIALILKGARHETYGKGIAITHYNLASVIARFEFDAMHEDQKDVILMVQKAMWMSGLYCFLKCCVLGSKLIVMNEFEEEGFMQAIEDYKVTYSYIYSSKLWQLYKYNYERDYDLSSCKYLQAFDGALPGALVSGLKEKFGLNLKASYGINELTGLGLQNTKETDSNKEALVGQLVPQLYGKARFNPLHKKTSVISDQTLRKAGPYERGEICFKGPVVTKGYINDPNSNRRLFDKDGYLQSGVYGYYDNDGYFFIIDRIFHVFHYKGQGVSPRQLEGLIKSLEPVKDALVTGIKHPTDGYYPIAFVSIQKGQTITSEEIVRYVNDKVEDHQKLRGGVIILPKIPRSRDTGALNRNIVRKVLSRYIITKEVTTSSENSAIKETEETKDKKNVDDEN